MSDFLPSALHNHEEDGTLDTSNVNTLIPLCARHPEGPQLNPSVYGYDIQQLQDKPWQKPGVNLADYFNYGFDELSYRAYCAQHPKGNNAVKLKADDYVRTVLGGLPPSNENSGPSYGRGGGGGAGYEPYGGSYGRGGGGRAGYKTRVCYSYRESGSCPRGSTCYFAHGDEELQRSFDAGSGAPPSSRSFPTSSAHEPLQGGSHYASGGGASSASGGGGGSAGFRMPPRPTQNEELFEEPEMKRARNF